MLVFEHPLHIVSLYRVLGLLSAKRASAGADAVNHRARTRSAVHEH